MILDEDWYKVHRMYKKLGFHLTADSLRQHGSFIRQTMDPKELLQSLTNWGKKQGVL